MKRFLFCVVLAIGLVIVTEVLAAVTYRIVYGERFSPAVCSTDSSGPGPSAATPAELDVAIHPFLGYVLRREYWSDYEVSEFGFLDDAPPIHRRAPDRVIVGVTGGSVAESFAFDAMDRLGSEILKDPRFAGREFIGVNLAVGGFKQPQQLMALAWVLSLGGEFDFFINLDGFNDVVLHRTDNAPKGIHPAFPRQWDLMVNASADNELLSRIGEVAHLGRRRSESACALEGSFLRRSATRNLLWRVRDEKMRAEIAQANLRVQAYRPQKLPLEATGPTTAAGSDVLRELVELWAQGSVQLSRLCEANGIRYLHFLQPNQYVEGSKPMGRKEREVAFDPEHPYARFAAEGFPRLIRAGKELSARGVDFHDMTGFFSEVDEPIYIDACCHLSEKGNEMLAEEIAAAILRAP